MIRTVRDAAYFCLYGLLLPSFGAAFLLHSLAPLIGWEMALAALLATEPKR